MLLKIDEIVNKKLNFRLDIAYYSSSKVIIIRFVNKIILFDNLLCRFT